MEDSLGDRQGLDVVSAANFVPHESGARATVGPLGIASNPYAHCGDLEEEMVKQAFLPTSFRMLKELPDYIGPSEVMATARAKMDAQAAPGSSHFRSAVKGGGLFYKDYVYDPSEYDMPRQIEAHLRMQHKENITKVHGDHEFKTASRLDREKLGLTTVSRQRTEEEYKELLQARRQAIAELKEAAALQEQEKRDKRPERNNSALIDPQIQEPSIRASTEQRLAELSVPLRSAALLLEEDAEDVEKRRKWLEKEKIISGPFMPPGKSRPVHEAASSKMPEIIRKLGMVIEEDWEEAECSVYADEEGMVVVEFDIVSVEDERIGLSAYMNVIAQRNDIITSNGLSKVVEVWDMEHSGQLYFAFRPSWVRRGHADSFFALHPDARNGVWHKHNQKR